AKGSQALLRSEQFSLGGALAAQLEVGPEFVAAIGAALGRNLHALVLRDHKRAPEIIAHLHAEQLGQAALLLAESSNDESASVAELPRNALGWAADKVKAAPSLDPVVRRLLGYVALFETVELALENRLPPRVGAATLRGEYISPDAVLFGGSGKVDSL